MILQPNCRPLLMSTSRAGKVQALSTLQVLPTEVPAEHTLKYTKSQGARQCFDWPPYITNAAFRKDPTGQAAVLSAVH